MSEKAKGFLTNLGYDPQYGARPLKRVLQKEVINELSRQILIGSFSFGDTIYVDANNKGLLFSKEPFEAVQLKADEIVEDED
jgi:ATP-dependent Clp protease ATP-binding subunit ClpB